MPLLCPHGRVAARGNEAWYPMTPRCPGVPVGIAALAVRPRAIVRCADYYKNAKKIWASNVLLMNKEKAHMRRCVQWRAFHRTRRHICAGTRRAPQSLPSGTCRIGGRASSMRTTKLLFIEPRLYK